MDMSGVELRTVSAQAFGGGRVRSDIRSVADGSILKIGRHKRANSLESGPNSGLAGFTFTGKNVAT